jgi:predicted Zn-dependent peptidase
MIPSIGRCAVRVCAIAFLLYTLGGCVTASPTPGSRGLPAPIREVLPNGMRLIIQEHRAAATVAVHLWAGVGGRDEAVGERGFSHFAEHMLFKGTETRPRGFVERDVEAVGGRTNAGTSNDYTFYYLLLPATRIVAGISLMADMVLNSVFDPTELARERDVVFEEVRLNEDNPRSSLGRQLYGLLYQGHPYGRSVLGDAGDLRGATQATLRGYYKRHYVPENMALVVVGPVNPAEVRTTAIAAFGAIPRAGYTRQALPAPAPLDGVRTRSVERPATDAARPPQAGAATAIRHAGVDAELHPGDAWARGSPGVERKRDRFPESAAGTARSRERARWVSQPSSRAETRRRWSAPSWPRSGASRPTA